MKKLILKLACKKALKDVLNYQPGHLYYLIGYHLIGLRCFSTSYSKNLYEEMASHFYWLPRKGTISDEEYYDTYCSVESRQKALERFIKENSTSNNHSLLKFLLWWS
jgi:hypothetical protein